MRKITPSIAGIIMGCSAEFVRIGLQQNVLDIGDAVKMSGRWTYNISPSKLADRQGLTMEQLEAKVRRIAGI